MQSRRLAPAVAAGCLAALAGAAGQQTTLKGEPFPVTEVVVIALITFGVAFVGAALAAWKSKQVEHAQEAAFHATGRLIGRSPCVFIVLSIVVLVATSGGMSMQEAETDPASLWVAHDSIA